MARARKLKVYRTSAGFHDAFVAAASQKAALAAWGVERNLFALGMADVVTDPALTKEPLAKPGTVIKRPSGTEAEQIAALSSKGRRSRASGRKSEAGSKPARRTRPRPSRKRLDAAEEALARAEERHEGERSELAKQEDEIARRRRALQQRHSKEIGRLERARDRASAAHAAALEKWRS
jgi:hypothetical protein